jgi:Fe-S oxidoreductase
MVTRDEQHTTRGRARILYEMLQGDVITDGFRSDEVHEALDLCLACKGCKGDCPVNVDMATYKAEFLSKHYKRRLRPLAAYSMGLIMFWARIASRIPRLANALTRIPLLGRLLMRMAGLSPKRDAPPFARETFRAWFRERGAVNPNGPPVVLFPDTFNEHFHPGTARSATRVLEAAGFRVIVPDGFLCCGRPLYDYGMLDTAKLLLKRLVDRLTPYARAGVPIVGLEPSCVAALRDELPAMLVHDEDATRISECTMTLAEFLKEHAEEWQMPRLAGRAIVHGHCHHEAIMGLDADRELLDRLGLDYEVLDSGCCGMAGSFGFEADKYDISVAIGERRLLPAVREAPSDSLIVADGFSCRTQIEQLTDRRAIHTAEAIELALANSGRRSPPPAAPAPERPRYAIGA